MPGTTILIPNYNSVNYIVKKGDNLYSIAKKYNISVDSILKANDLANNNLQIGQNIVIPINSNINNSTDYFTYTVKKGDNLYDIAKKYNTTIDNIKNLNNLISNNLFIGQQLIIMENSSNVNTPNENQIYIVQPNDTIYSIANKFNISVNNIVKDNSLKSNILSPGQALIINENTYKLPTQIKECFGTSYKPPSYETYTVKKGDNLYDIAKEFNTTSNNLMQLNNLKSDNLFIGQVLNVKEKK